MKNYLFIGGVYDGRVRTCNGERILHALHPPTARAIKDADLPVTYERIEADTYELCTRCYHSSAGELTLEFYRLASLNDYQVMQRLLNNYRPL